MSQTTAGTWMGRIPGYELIKNFSEDFFSKIYQTGPIPKHVAFVMDGNRRFAKKKHIEIKEGHNSGFYSMARVLELCYKAGVEEATVFAFSIENFNRSKDEIDWIMDLAKQKFIQICQNGELAEKYGISIRILGDTSRLPQDVLESLNDAVELTKDNKSAILNVCFPYTSRDDITTGIKSIISLAASHKIDTKSITEETLEQHMYFKNSPPLDILVRTSGMTRLSDFMLWQCHESNCMIEFIDILWPDLGIVRMMWILLKWSYRTVSSRDDPFKDVDPELEEKKTK